MLATSGFARGANIQDPFDTFFLFLRSDSILPADAVQLFHRMRHYADGGFALVPHSAYYQDYLPEDLEGVKRMVTRNELLHFKRQIDVPSALSFRTTSDSDGTPMYNTNDPATPAGLKTFGTFFCVESVSE